MPTARLAAHILKDIVLGISEQDTPVPHSYIKIFRESPGTLSSSTAGAGTGAPGGSLAAASGSCKPGEARLSIKSKVLHLQGGQSPRDRVTS